MNLVTIQCPACNAQLELPEGMPKAFCMYCGNQVIGAAKAAKTDDFQIEAGVLVRYRGNDAHVVVPDGVREIGEGAFKGAYIDSVVLPQGLMAIGNEAFSGSTLSEVNLPSTVGRIGIEAFCGTRITEAEIPAGATLCARAFCDCAQLERVTLPSDLDILCDSCFGGCKSLKSIEIPASVEEICSFAFSDCSSLSEVTFAPGSKLKVIGYKAFRGCALTRIDILATVEKIEDDAFAGCAFLSDISFAPGLRLARIGRLGACASLERIVIPASVEAIGARAFSGCDALSEVRFETGSRLRVVDDYAFWGCALTSIELPNGVEAIGREVFFGNPLKEFSYPAIKGAAPSTLAVNGDIERITFHPDCDLPHAEYYALFSGLTKLREVEFNGALGERVSFEDCPSLESVSGMTPQLYRLLGTSVQSPLFQRLRREEDEKIMHARERKERQEAARQEQIRAQWRHDGKCQHCGGSFKGLVGKTCMSCGKKKDY